jgi:hypothetical protein
MKTMTEAEFDVLLDHFLQKPVTDLTDTEIAQLITVSQGATDRLLNEWERRGLLGKHEGAVIVPDYTPPTRYVETCLTR